MSKYFNDAIIGNRKLTASFTKKGELLRFNFPIINYRQMIDEFIVGVKVNNSSNIYLHDDSNNVYVQSYIDKTNILQTEIFNSYFNLRILQVDFVSMNENLLVKSYKFKNENTIDLDIDFSVYSKLLSNDNDDVSGYIKNDALIQYTHNYSLCIFSKNELLAYQINGARDTFKTGVVLGKDYIGLSKDSSISYKLKTLKPGEETTFNLYLYVNDNERKSISVDLENEIERIRKIDIRDALEDCKKYWKKQVKDSDKIGINKSNADNKIKDIYNRTILLFNLLYNEEIGGISAAMEIDEYKTKCGRYGFCWPRDAVFICKAMDALGMKDEVAKFYNVFCRRTQEKNGMWEQRFYLDGRLAPSWGYQIDETASVISGVLDHYVKTKDKEFLKEAFKMCEKATTFLLKYIYDIIDQRNEMRLSYDLWEEHEGISIYSIAAIFGAFNAMLKLDEFIKPTFDNNRLKIEAINKRDKELSNVLIQIKEYILRKFYDTDKKTFVRNIEDKKMDMSVLGVVVPFGVFTPKEKNILNTIEKIDMTLRTYTGGYLRYEGDTYNGGKSPWILTNLWMALYYIELKEYDKAKENFDFVTKTATEHGFLGEQINNETMRPDWVIGLAWSHAMYILVLENLKKLKIIK